MTKLVLEKSEMHTKYKQHQAQLDLEKNELTKKYNKLEAKYEEKCLALLVTQAKLTFNQRSVEAHMVECEKSE